MELSERGNSVENLDESGKVSELSIADLCQRFSSWLHAVENKKVTLNGDYGIHNYDFPIISNHKKEQDETMEIEEVRMQTKSKTSSQNQRSF